MPLPIPGQPGTATEEITIPTEKVDTNGFAVKPKKRRSSNREPAVFGADEVTQDDELGLVIARGDVEISQGNRTLQADVVSYNQRTDTVIASGNVTLIQDAGDTIFGDYIELTDQMRDGFIKNVKILLSDRSRLVGNAARRTNGTRIEMRRAVYSPCDLCKDDPTAPPIFQIKAEQVTQDKELQLVEYRDATLELGGIPIFYTPYLSHPDPSVKRRSGFLAPTFGSSTQLGANLTIPYYFVLGPDKDATFSPIITADQGVVLAGDYRERFANGFLNLKGSITSADGVSTFVQTGTPSRDQVRFHLFADGKFDLDDEFRAGFSIRRTSDQTYLRVYRFGGTDNFLRSRGFLERFDERDYGVINTYGFQALRQGLNDRQQAIILPSFDYTFAGKPLSFGGKLTTSINVLNLLRESGSSSRRISTGTEFNLPFDGFAGQKFNFVAGIRGDGYYTTNFARTTNGPRGTATDGRLFPQIGLEWRYPFVRKGLSSTIILEPTAAIYAAPNGSNPNTIQNDDSINVDFNETDLFTRNRAVGFDQVDSGQRVDYGLRASYSDNTSFQASFLGGQSYRFQKSSPLAINGSGDGLHRQESDYVGRFLVSPTKDVNFIYRFRFDQRDLRPQRQEYEIGTNLLSIHGGLSYIDLANNVRDNQLFRRQVSLNLEFPVSQYWSISTRSTQDLAGSGNSISSGFGVQYADECFTFSSSITRDGTRDRDVRPGTTLLLQLVFKNLGEISLPTIQTTSRSSS